MGLCTAKLTVWKPRHLNPPRPSLSHSFLLLHPPTPVNESVRVGINSLALSIRPSVYPSVCLSVCGSHRSVFCPSVSLSFSVVPFIAPRTVSICPSVCLSRRLCSRRLSAFLSVDDLSVAVLFNLSVFPSICVCLSFIHLSLPLFLCIHPSIHSIVLFISISLSKHVLQDSIYISLSITLYVQYQYLFFLYLSINNFSISIILLYFYQSHLSVSFTLSLYHLFLFFLSIYVESSILLLFCLTITYGCNVWVSTYFWPCSSLYLSTYSSTSSSTYPSLSGGSHVCVWALAVFQHTPHSSFAFFFFS